MPRTSACPFLRCIAGFQHRRTLSVRFFPFSEATPTSLPTELITTIISALIGWVQIKKYNELSASYALTAHEIGLIKEQSYYISSEKDFLDFIRDAETAFSREHTQWQARRIV
ncbi:TPA: SLATT domain-containing protein [Morganella morganii]|nr:SLATT domain-containing protein [Morganella morganii]